MENPAPPMDVVPTKASADSRASVPETDAPEARRTAVLVLGMHRSGTSAITRVINLLGADLSANLMPASKGNNEAGFWESEEASALNGDILASAGSSWDDWSRVDPLWSRPADRDVFKSRALQILGKDFAGSSLFVLKDPRICRLLPFWFEVLRAFDAEPKIVLSIRNPIEVAASLKKRDGFSPSKSHKLWLRHVLDSEYGTRGLTRAVVTYDSLLDDWRSAITKLSGDLGVDWLRRSTVAATEIDGFLQPRHRHHAATEIEVDDRAEIVDWIKETYSALIELQSDPGSIEALGRLDSVRADFDRAVDAPAGRGPTEEREEAHVGAFSGAREDQVSTDGDSRLEARIAELTTMLACEIQGKEEMRRAKNRLALRLNEIQTSATWQLTRPLHSVESRWPGLMRGLVAVPKLAWWAITMRLKERLRLRRQAQELLETGLFDLPWYVEQNPDVVLEGVNPVMHWLATGWKENRDPNPRFDIALYLQKRPELAQSGVNPLVHYLDSEVRGGGVDTGER